MMPKGVEHRSSAAQAFVLVLNAFRHHWNSHTTEYEVVEQARWCSTPFGIIGILTARVPSLLFARCYKTVFGHLLFLPS